ncbi:tetratricopeptide repeat protein [bacterium]|nr:MAG: tetratricopeptide repeat protein [bacterium]
MALSTKHKKFIDENRTKWNTKQLADKISQSVEEVQAYLDENTLPEISSSKAKWFTLIAVSIPIVFFFALELGLRLANYKGDLSLFIVAESLNREYTFPNPNYAKRYFFNTAVVPNPGKDAFLTQKPANGFRVFALGGSSAAGYPYMSNVRFTKYAELALKDVLPDKYVEVVNLGTSAINTYTLYDQVDEVLEQKPDAIFIYAGHNEFYGALGVASSESLGAFPAFVRMYLGIQRLKTFLLLRDVITWIMAQVQGEPHKSGTLMEQVVREQEIPLESDLYQLGKIQFESNMMAIVSKFRSHGIPVYISSLASNQKDQKPFISSESAKNPKAIDIYHQAQVAFSKGNIQLADSLFTFAKDLDALRFRASSEFNTLIKEMAEKTGSVYVSAEEDFKEKSPNGIIGNELMLEHLHPNVDGYSTLGKSFVDVFLLSPPKNLRVNRTNLRDWTYYNEHVYVTDFDKTIAEIKLLRLKSGWPFVQKNEYKNVIIYKPETIADSLALDVVENKITLEEAKVKLAETYTKRRQIDKAIHEYLSIIVDIPYSASAYVFVGKLYIDSNRLDKAEPFLEIANRLDANAFTKKMLGAIKIDKKEYESGIRYLKESIQLNPKDPQALYNLAGGYALNRQFKEAKETAEKVKEINPNYPGLMSLINQLKNIK